MLLGRKEVEPKNMAERSLSCLFGGRAKKKYLKKKKKERGAKVGNRKRKKERKKGRKVNTLNKNFIKFSAWFL